MDNNIQNINDEIQQVLNNFRFYSREDNQEERTNDNNNTSETQLLYMLHETVHEYNNVVRLNETNMRRYHDNVGTYIQFLNRAHIQRRRNQQYGYFSQNNNSVPNAHFSWYPRRNRSPQDTFYTNIINETINHVLPNVFHDVPVNSTPEQVDNATETFDYQTGEYNHTRCPITLDEFQENERVCRIRHCGHIFRENAIKNWFRQNVRCPVCRYDIRTNNETEPGDDEAGLPTTDVSLNPLPRPRPTINSTIQNISNGLQGILQNYLDGDSVIDGSLNRVFSFEIPLYIYNDLSGNTV
jgi:hypothetical protein